MNRRQYLFLFTAIGGGLLCVAYLLNLPLAVWAQGPLNPEFTYQGRLVKGGAYVDGVNCNFRVALFATPAGGAALGSGQQTINGVALTDGYFTLDLDFGNVFDGDPRYLEIAVQCPPDTGFTTLSGRAEIKAAPYALHAQVAAVADSVSGVAWSNVNGKPSGFADNIDNDQLSLKTCPTDGEVLKFNSGTWECSQETDTLVNIQNSCGQAGDVPKWNGVTWFCEPDANTEYNIGTGINIDGSNTISLDFNQVAQANHTHNAAQVNTGTLDPARYSAHDDLAAENYLGNTTGDLAQNNGIVQTDLNADRLDSQEGAYYLDLGNHSGTLSTDRYSARSDLSAEGYLGDASGDLAQNNGTLQGDLNADRLDDQEGAYYLDLGNHSGTLSTDRYSAQSDLSTEGYLGNAGGDLAQNNGTLQVTLNADRLDNQEGVYYLDLANHTGTLSDTTFSAYDDLLAEGYSVALRNGVLQASLNADLLDNQEGAYYLDLANHTGTLSDTAFSAYDDLAAEGYLGNAGGDLAQNNGALQTTLNADLLDGNDSTAFAAATHDHLGESWVGSTIPLTLSNTTAASAPDLVLDGSNAVLASDPTDNGSDVELRANDDVRLYLDDDDNTANSEFRVYGGDSEASAVFKVQEDGDVYADGGYHCGETFGGSPPSPCLVDKSPADFAEMLPAAPAEPLEPGDVLVISPAGELTRSSQAYQPTVVGAYSTRPSYLGNAQFANEAGFAPLALVGVVPVKVSAENGAIRPGDLLAASSTPGHAMRAEPDAPNGTVIGKALESLDQETGLIQMIVMLQ